MEEKYNVKIRGVDLLALWTAQPEMPLNNKSTDWTASIFKSFQ